MSAEPFRMIYLRDGDEDLTTVYCRTLTEATTAAGMARQPNYLPPIILGPIVQQLEDGVWVQAGLSGEQEN